MLAPSIVVRRLNAAGDWGVTEMRVLLPASEAYGVKLNIGVPCPQWSPDGNRLAYLAYSRSSSPGRSRRRAARVDARRPGTRGQSRKAGLRRGGICLVAGRRRDRICGVRGSVACRAGWRRAVPDLAHGRQADLRFVVVAGQTRRHRPDRCSRRGRRAREVLSVHVVDVDTGTERMLAETHVYDYVASWSPDGSRLAFVGDDGHIRVSDRDEGSTARLSPRKQDGGAFEFWDVAWSPDGERLLALARSDRAVHGFALVSLSTDSASAEVLTPWTWALDWINLGDVSWQPTK